MRDVLMNGHLGVGFEQHAKIRGIKMKFRCQRTERQIIFAIVRINISLAAVDNGFGFALPSLFQTFRQPEDPFPRRLFKFIYGMTVKQCFLIGCAIQGCKPFFH
ncbi:hypothetical protein D1872_301970 [compost metagenome]